MTAAEFIKGLVYDNQLNRTEAARSFERALKNYPEDADPFLKNSIYVYYTNELRNMDDTLRMHKTLDEWLAYIQQVGKNPDVPRRQLSNWLYYYYHCSYFYYLTKKDLDKAAQQVDSVVKHVEVNGWSKVTRNEVLGYRTRLAIERKDYAEALKLNNEQLPEAKELDINAYSEVLKQRAIIMANTGRWQEGYHALDEHYELVDSINKKETRQQLAQYQQQQSQAAGPSTSRTTSSEPVGQAEATGKDCSRLANGPSNGSSSRQRTSGSGFHREGDTAEDDFPSSPGNGNKASSSSEERTGRGGSSYVNQLSAGYESVDSPTGSENSLTHHSNDTDSSHDPQEEKPVSGKGNRTAASRHVQNGLNSSVNVQGSVL
jgi:hypothetical protein